MSMALPFSSFWILVLAKCSAGTVGRPMFCSASPEGCNLESAAIEFDMVDGDLVLLQKNAKTKQANAIHSEDIALSKSSLLEQTEHRLRAYMQHKMRISGTSRHYVIAQIIMIVLIAVAVLCLSCVRIFRYPWKSTRLPNKSWLDFRAEGGVRHSVLEWSDSLCNEATTKKIEEAKSKHREESSDEEKLEPAETVAISAKSNSRLPPTSRAEEAAVAETGDEVRLAHTDNVAMLATSTSRLPPTSRADQAPVAETGDEMKLAPTDSVAKVAKSNSNLPPTSRVDEATVADPLMNSVTAWYEAKNDQTYVADPLANSLTGWYADGKPLPDTTTPDTKYHPISQRANVADPLMNSLTPWYEAPANDQVQAPPPLGRSLSGWYADGKPFPDASTPDTKFHALSHREKNQEGPQTPRELPKSVKLKSVPEPDPFQTVVVDKDRKSVSTDRVVLFVHAASLCAGTWSPIVRRLKNVTAIAYDQRGHGDSDAPKGVADYNWEVIGQDFLRIVESVTARYGRPPDACVTHSFAGDCVLLALAKNPMPVGRLILLDPVFADAEGATIGAKRLADATRVCGQRELEGFGSEYEVGEHLERMVLPQLARDGLDSEAKDMYSMYGSAPNSADRWQLKCSRQHEAAIYENRVPLAEHLAHQNVDADVQVVFAEKRRTAMSVSQAVAADRDRKIAERVLKTCRSGSSLHELNGVGHFLVLEAPELVASKIEELLPRA